MRLSLGRSIPEIRAIFYDHSFLRVLAALALPLFMLGVVADDHDLPLALDDFALLTHLLYGRTYFHCIITFLSQRGLCFACRDLVPGKGSGLRRPTSSKMKSQKHFREKFLKNLQKLLTRLWRLLSFKLLPRAAGLLQLKKLLSAFGGC